MRMKLYVWLGWAIILFVWFHAAKAQTMSGGCGVPPLAPPGMYYMCICDKMGNNCQLILISKR